MGYRWRRMYYLTGLPGWIRFGYSPGWLGRSPTGLSPTAEWILRSGLLPQFRQYVGGQTQPVTPTFPGALMSKEEEARMLEEQAKAVEGQLEVIKKRLENLRKAPAAQPPSFYPQLYPFGAGPSVIGESTSLEEYKKWLEEEIKNVEIMMEKLRKKQGG